MPLLQQELRNSDSEIRLAAAIAIAHIQPESQGLAEILLAGLRSPDRELSDKANQSLDKLGSELKSILPQLREGLKRNSFRSISARLLERILAESTEAIPYLVDLLKERKGPGYYAPRALAAAGSEAISPIVELLEHRDAFVRARAIKTIGLMGGQAVSMVPTLVAKLSTGSVSERVAAAGALGNIGPAGAAQAVPALRTVVKDRDLAIRREAIEALGELKEHAEPAIRELCEILKERPAMRITWRIVRTLRSVGEAAVPALLQCLRSGDEEVRRLTARELSDLGEVVED